MSESLKDVHTEHCCIYHGCKYGDDDCTVTERQASQSYPCEECERSKLEYRDAQKLKWFTPVETSKESA